jgi:outer membrane protein OmpA-like peptidoglycan-associated protein
MAWIRAALVPVLVLMIGTWVGAAFAQELRDRTDILRNLAPRADDPGAGADRRSIDLQIQFAVGSTNLTEAAMEQLDTLAAAITSEALVNQRFLVAGHTDATGADDLNLELSFRRARAVKAYLVEAHLISPARLAVVGYGELRLKDPFNPAGAVNRRVEIVALGALLR